MGAAERWVATCFAAASTASARAERDGDNVGVAPAAACTSYAATSTLDEAAGPMTAEVVGVPDWVVATNFASTSTTSTALAERAPCVAAAAEILLPSR